MLVAGGEPLSKEIEELRNLAAMTQQASRSGLVDVAGAPQRTDRTKHLLYAVDMGK